MKNSKKYNLSLNDSERYFGIAYRVEIILILVLVINWSVALSKIIIGLKINSTSTTTDGIHSLGDGASNIVGLIGIFYAKKPVDKNHPYGHRKFEMLAGLFIGFMLLAIGLKMGVTGIYKMMQPQMHKLSMTVPGIIIMCITIFINIAVSKYEYTRGKKLKSQILISDSLHTKSDIFVSIGVLITLIGIKLGLPSFIDTVTSVVVAGFILHAAVEIFISNSNILLDKVAVEPEKIRNIVLEFDEVKGIHRIRSRGNSNEVYIDFHILLEPNMDIERSHILMHNIEKKINDSIDKKVQVEIHLEPYHTIKKQEMKISSTQQI
ncbi:cation diffusion facilitator family transporter [Clostridium oryzae]|uniref:Putative cation efflux system proteinc n=1 Tax=Clostridium oryzae TaxID=1450648 RepID=A0A1V4I558_9CLOT|nr:cation diffusion facilitator family transporter [Clostridium oryzae]OPJ55014.1 putative cation efflux system proteinc [Clostridium oryzae]